MRARRLSDERGIALAVAVFALVVIGVLVAGTFFAGRLEQQTGRNAIYAAQAAEVAEAGLNEAVNSQTAAALLAMAVDANPANAIGLTTYSPPSGYASATRSINRLTDNLFLVRSLGAKTNAGGGQLATRSLGQLIRLVQLDIDVKAGLTALGDVTITGGAEVSGYDLVPPLWGGIDCPPLDSVTGVRYNNGTLTQKGNGSYEGDPASEVDASLNPTDMKKAFDQLKAMATLVLANSNPAATVPAYTATVPLRCNTAVETNWGEPEVNIDPCFNYFPVIYHNGNLKLQGDRGQGILLVEGDLTVTGSMVFYGPVFVTGTLSTSGTGGDGAKFYGGVIAGNVALDDLTKLAGGAMVNYSSCALKRALDNTATPAPLAERSWVQLYSLQ